MTLNRATPTSLTISGLNYHNNWQVISVGFLNPEIDIMFGSGKDAYSCSVVCCLHTSGVDVPWMYLEHSSSSLNHLCKSRYTPSNRAKGDTLPCEGPFNMKLCAHDPLFSFRIMRSEMVEAGTSISLRGFLG